jgi:hypothetical protein
MDFPRILAMPDCAPHDLIVHAMASNQRLQVSPLSRDRCLYINTCDGKVRLKKVPHISDAFETHVQKQFHSIHFPILYRLHTT